MCSRSDSHKQALSLHCSGDGISHSPSIHSWTAVALPHRGARICVDLAPWPWRVNNKENIGTRKKYFRIILKVEVLALSTLLCNLN